MKGMIGTQKYWKALVSRSSEADALAKSDGFSLKIKIPGLQHPEGRAEIYSTFKRNVAFPTTTVFILAMP